MRNNIIKIVTAGLLVTFANSACWISSKGRGVGEVLNSCPAGHEQNGALCYPVCEKGYYGVGPVCWQDCPEGFRNDGAHCGKPEAYGRGSGYVVWDDDKCARENPPRLRKRRPHVLSQMQEWIFPCGLLHLLSILPQ